MNATGGSHVERQKTFKLKISAKFKNPKCILTKIYPKIKLFQFHINSGIKKLEITVPLTIIARISFYSQKHNINWVTRC